MICFISHVMATPTQRAHSEALLCGDESGKEFYENTRNSTLTVERMSSIDGGISTCFSLCVLYNRKRFFGALR